MRRQTALLCVAATLVPSVALGQRHADSAGRLRVALARQPVSPTGLSPGPATMASGGIRAVLAALGVTVRDQEAALTAEEGTEYGGWKRLGWLWGTTPTSWPRTSVTVTSRWGSSPPVHP